MKHWAADLIGIPWSPDRNCWWLVREVYRLRFGVELPHLGIGDLQAADSVAAIKAAAVAAGIRPASGPAQEFDVVLCRDLTGKRHCGVMIEWRAKLQLLHSDGHMSNRGPVGSVIRQPLAEASQLTNIELWRRA
jgi:hypothetical protein